MFDNCLNNRQSVNNVHLHHNHSFNSNRKLDVMKSYRNDSSKGKKQTFFAKENVIKIIYFYSILSEINVMQSIIIAMQIKKNFFLKVFFCLQGSFPCDPTFAGAKWPTGISISYAPSSTSGTKSIKLFHKSKSKSTKLIFHQQVGQSQ